MSKNKSMDFIYQGTTQKGRPISVRYPQSGDLQDLWAYINELSTERTFLRFQGEQVTLEQEKEYLDDQMRKIKNHEGVLILAFCEGELAGVAGVEMDFMTERHLGRLGISLKRAFRSEGLGKILLQLVTDEATKNLPDLEILTLAVFSNNKQAIEMYKRRGFMEYGNLPRGTKLERGYVDRILMYKELKCTKFF